MELRVTCPSCGRKYNETVLDHSEWEESLELLSYPVMCKLCHESFFIDVELDPIVTTFN